VKRGLDGRALGAMWTCPKVSTIGEEWARTIGGEARELAEERERRWALA